MFDRRPARRRPAAAIGGALAGAALIAASLSGCSALAPDGKVQSCLALQGPLTSAGTKLQSALQNAQEDPQGTLTALKEVHDDLETPFSKIKNAEIKQRATDANASLDELTTTLEKTLADPANADTQALQTSATATQTAFTDLVSECAPKAE